MNLKEEEKLLEKKCENAKDKIMKYNILLKYNKINTKKNLLYQINISFPNISEPKKDYEFIFEINLTKKTIILFSKNIKPISDGRDILPLIINTPTITNNYSLIDDINILDITNKIKIFIEAQKFIGLAGIFYIGEEYEQKIIDSLENIDKIQCNHLDIINGKFIELPSLCTISDEHFCLYEKEQNKYNLIFYSNIRNLLSFNKSIDSIVTLNWRKKVITNNNEITFNIFELKITSIKDKDMDKVMDILIEKIKNIGFKMNINEQKKGVLPNINVEKIEREIIRLESQFKKRDNVLVFNKLLEKYEKIIEYYSAVNDNKYTEYSQKMKDLLGNEKYSKYIS
jgi:hypothetical protein